MPQDYNIYIRSMNTGGQSDPTRPWGQNGNSELQPTVAWNPQNIQAAAQGVNMGMHPSQLAAMGRNEVLQEFVGIAVAFQVVKSVAQAVSSAITFRAETLQIQSGDFGSSIRWNNLRQLYHNIKDPFATTINIAKEEDRRRIENERKNLQMALLGETMVNRGV